MKFGFANNLRLEENKDLPINSNLGDKVSDFVGLNINIMIILNWLWFFSKNNFDDKNYEILVSNII